MPANTTYFNNRNLLILEVQKKIIKSQVVLDIGCSIQPQNYITPIVHICCEPFIDYVKHLQHKIQEQKEINLIDRQYIFINATWIELAKYLPEKSVDTIFLLDVIEHLDAQQGKELLIWAEKIARCQIIIFTPLGFVKQEHPDGKDAWGMDGGKWQEHKSGWIPADFDETWQAYVAENFHYEDNIGNTYDIPVGAFYIIKTMPNYIFAKPNGFSPYLSKFYKAINLIKMKTEATALYEITRKQYRYLFPKNRSK